jgi:hypothetical protein
MLGHIGLQRAGMARAIGPAGLRLASVAMEASKLAHHVAHGHGQASSSVQVGSGVGPEEVSPFLFI